MILTFFNTGFDVTKNGVYENLQAYLATRKVQSYEYKHIDPALTITVKLPLSSHQFDKSAIGDYVEVDDDSSLYYYYVMNMKWKGKETLEVSLGLDTLNTFWKEISSSLTAETHITREFRDRWSVRGDTSRYTVYARIDPVSEDFSAIPMERKNVVALNPASSRKWTLVYLTEYNQSEQNLSENPVNCYVYPSSTVSVATGTTGSVEWDNRLFSSNRAFAVSASDNPNFILVVNGKTVGTSNGSIWIVFSSTYKKYYVKQFIKNYTSGVEIAYEYESESITFTTCDKVYEQDYEYANSLSTSSSYSKYWPSEGKMDYSKPITINAGESYSTLMTFDAWYSLNKTDGRLVKIRELPYAPFKETYSDGNLVIPSGWEVKNQGLRLTANTFGSYSLLTRSMELIKPELADIVDKAPDILYETKLLNSSFYSDKLVYDTNTWVAQWERFGNRGNPTALNLLISYAVSDGMDNGLLFTVNTTFGYDTDFGQCMVCDKSTDKPYFTNEYLNYLRYGKYVDEKAVGFNTASTVVSSVGSIASTVASTAFGIATSGLAGAGVGAAIGAAVGIATAAISIAKTSATAYDSINSKIDAYTHQSSSVSGTSDVSLFNLYSGNKLLNVIYEPRSDIKEALWQYFRLYGYATDAYRVPVCSRRWVDYFKVEPVFSGDMIWNDFLDDIKQRMQLGYRVFHFVNNTYDLHLQYENWETTLWKWSQA